MGRRVEFNPKMQGEWFHVHLAKAMSRTFDPWGTDHLARRAHYHAMEEHNRTLEGKLPGAREWCENVCHGRWTEGLTWHQSQYGYRFSFRGRNDAIQFKLIWGGV